MISCLFVCNGKSLCFHVFVCYRVVLSAVISINGATSFPYSYCSLYVMSTPPIYRWIISFLFLFHLALLPWGREGLYFPSIPYAISQDTTYRDIASISPILETDTHMEISYHVEIFHDTEHYLSGIPKCAEGGWGQKHLEGAPPPQWKRIGRNLEWAAT